jgi:3-oxoacyl-(acyl-carrier-protein) synthase
VALEGHADGWQEIRQAAKFAQYGLAATDEALRDAGFEGGKGLDGDMTVSVMVV